MEPCRASDAGEVLDLRRESLPSEAEAWNSFLVHPSHATS